MGTMPSRCLSQPASQCHTVLCVNIYNVAWTIIVYTIDKVFLLHFTRILICECVCAHGRMDGWGWSGRQRRAGRLGRRHRRVKGATIFIQTNYYVMLNKQIEFTNISDAANKQQSSIFRAIKATIFNNIMSETWLKMITIIWRWWRQWWWRVAYETMTTHPELLATNEHFRFGRIRWYLMPLSLEPMRNLSFQFSTWHMENVQSNQHYENIMFDANARIMSYTFSTNIYFGE